MSKLVVVGSANADLVFSVDRLPKPGETMAASHLEILPGGKGANQAAAASKLGYETYFVGQVGQDANATMLRESLAACGTDLTHLREVDGPSGTALILLQQSGENSIVIVGGANQSHWVLTDAVKDIIRSAGSVLLQREIPEDVNVQVAQIAKAAGVAVLLDAGGVEGPICPDLLACLSCLSPNETELNRMTGLPTDTIEQVHVAADSLMRLGVGSVLVKLGSDGSLLIPGAGQPIIRQHAIKAPIVMDTTGAGDCFTAAYCVALLEGKKGTDALLFASAAASICVRRKGAMPSLPSREEVDDLIKEQH
ncbi:hypothetical protein CEUSTIGMA_g1582.t1 [Chlamydomonas eustigma]|uniref:Ribokinase n=1 Tax=Chlamydomonas eustigma TaxID=1157962 RepID=A0A250WTJ2_9CHLO|nr:hypothetical protein CEUSTIGMA_g1582.t1 [Chlamydomonas eustigma]|eukprot:GAX74133.1 hypothetical protein CEUSTIGMA_g1582.t1 [Chlamydomonas eustigma]